MGISQRRHVLGHARIKGSADGEDAEMSVEDVMAMTGYHTLRSPDGKSVRLHVQEGGERSVKYRPSAGIEAMFSTFPMLGKLGGSRPYSTESK